MFVMVLIMQCRLLMFQVFSDTEKGYALYLNYFKKERTDRYFNKILKFQRNPECERVIKS